MTTPELAKELTRICKECLVEKSLDKFHRNAPSRSGRLLICGDCINKKEKPHRFKIRDKRRFGGNKLKTLERDGYKCVKCGMTNEEHMKRWGRMITVDHVDGNGRNSEYQNNDLSNLSTLCLSCHGTKDYQKYLSRKLNEASIIVGEGTKC